MLSAALNRTSTSRRGVLWVLVVVASGGLLKGQPLDKASPEGESPTGIVHAMTDISHEFTFYFDGRFGKNYVTPRGGRDARNWGTLHECDLNRVNLLVLQSGATPCPYPPKDIAAVRRFLKAGGGVLVLGDYTVFRKEKRYRLNELVRSFGAEFVRPAAKKPLKAAAELKAKEVRTYGGKTIRLEKPKDWDLLICDVEGKVVMARRKIGKGALLVASRALAGRKPDASDPINARWWQPLLQRLAAGKDVDRRRAPRSAMPENKIEKKGLRIECSDYLQPMAEEIFSIYSQCRPALERIMGVPPAEGMLANLILLPTGGGGFSSGRAIGLGVFWGGFPDKKYGMVELLGHEATHAWVLPFAEPMWNEGIATYVGILLGRELGYEKEANATLKNWIKGARRHDPEMKKLCLRNKSKVSHAVRMAKPMWIWEQLRKEKPDVLQRYFQTKRKMIDPAKRRRYTEDDCVAVLSLAMGRDLFPWFRSLGIDVDRERTDITR